MSTDDGVIVGPEFYPLDPFQSPPAAQFLSPCTGHGSSHRDHPRPIAPLFLAMGSQ